MKFVIAVVMLALAIGAQSSVLPLAYAGHGHALSYSSVSGPSLVSAHGIHTAHGLHASHGLHTAHGLHAAHDLHAVHGLHAYHAAPLHAAYAVHAAPAVVHAPVHLAHEGTYVAKTRGSVHTAPLPGHIHSAASINLAPAPGTW